MSVRGGAGLLVGLLAISGGGPAGAGDPPRLETPIACPADLGCLVRNHVDLDPGPDAADYRCGKLTYDGHKGVDIRVPDSVALMLGVAVLAAADGTVLRLRDGMADASTRVIGADAVKDRMAGNGVIVDHGDGWETQYSHLRQGSIVLRVGDKVAAGQQIGLTGLSGNTEFIHLHFEVRRNGAVVDPFTGVDMSAGCNVAAAPLWSDRALGQLAYRAAALFDAGFAAEPPDQWLARAGEYGSAALPADSAALVFWIDVIGRQPGDEQAMRLLAPDGATVAEARDTVTGTSVQWFQFIGRKRPATGWPPGRYRGEYRLTRDAGGVTEVVLEFRREIELR